MLQEQNQELPGISLSANGFIAAENVVIAGLAT
jgi:hypothetical protein